MGRKGTRSRKHGRKSRGGRFVRTLAKAVVPLGLFMTQKSIHSKHKRKSRRSRRSKKSKKSRKR